MARSGNTKNVGRHYKEAATRVARVDSRITKHQLDALPSLLELIDLYEEQCIATPTPRHYYLAKFIEEVRLLLSEE